MLIHLLDPPVMILLTEGVGRGDVKLAIVIIWI
jgi:hypothetical protein